MTVKWKPQFRVSHLLWVSLVVAIFFAGRLWERATLPKFDAGSFKPKGKVEIAISGKFDLDADGTSDAGELINYIAKSGGVVTCYETPNGNAIGHLSASTRYLVVGYGHTLDPSKSEIVSEANRLGIDIIDEDKILDWIGVRKSDRVVRRRREITESTGSRLRPAASQR